MEKATGGVSCTLGRVKVWVPVQSSSEIARIIEPCWARTGVLLLLNHLERKRIVSEGLAFV